MSLDFNDFLCEIGIFVMFWFSPFWRKKKWHYANKYKQTCSFFFISRYIQLRKNSDLTLDHGTITCSFLNPTLTPNRHLKIIPLHFYAKTFSFIVFKLPATLVVSKRRWHKGSLCSPSCHVPRGCVQTHAGVVLIWC